MATVKTNVDSNPAYGVRFSAELSEDLGSIISSGGKTTDLNKEVTAFFNENEDKIKRKLQQNITFSVNKNLKKDNEPQIDWSDIKDDEDGSGERTKTQRVNDSFNNSKKDARRIAGNLAARNRQIQSFFKDEKVGQVARMLETDARRRGEKFSIEGFLELSEKEQQEAIARSITNSMRDQMNKALDHDDRRLAITEATKTRFETFKKGYPEGLVLWRGEPDACPLCTPYIGNVYDINDMPSPIPVHPNCRCWVEPYEDE